MWWQSNTTIKISIHALLAESDHFATLKFVNPYISIHALLAESDNIPLPNAHVISISIHALLAESDSKPRALKSRRMVFLSTLSLRRATQISMLDSPHSKISIHALLAESDLFEYIQAGTGILFLSTLSLRRATEQSASYNAYLEDFYPRSPCGERQPATTRNNKHNIFLSTLSLRRAT